MTGATFRCGHPREPSNMGPRTGPGRYPTCALCARCKAIVRSVDATLARWRQPPRLTIGEKIVRGLA
jgi:hypothetical protein